MRSASLHHASSRSSRIAVARAALIALVAGVGVACSPRVIEEDAGTQLDAGTLVTCVDDSQCGPGGRCVQNICGSSECTAKAECPAGEVCLEGSCALPPDECASSAHCPGTTLCDGFSRTCFDPDFTGCLTANDCTQEPGCDDGCTCDDGDCVPDSTGGDAGNPTGNDAGATPGGSLDLGGYVLENRENDPPQQATILPNGTSLSAGQVLVIARAVSKSDFENEWGTLPSNAKFLNANIEGSGVPIVNGGEKFAVRSRTGTTIDGPTISGSTGMSYQRTDDGDANDDGSWTESADADATPGTIEIASSHVGLVITEWSDSSGGGYEYEFIELAYLP